MKKGVGHWSACKACCIDKAKCEWIAGSHADSKEGGSISGVVASSFQVASLSQVGRSSPPQPEVHCKQDNWVELHQNPSYESINRGPAKWALATLELIHAMRVVIVEDELR